MKKLRITGVFLLAVLLIFTSVPAQAAYQPGFELQAQAVYMVNVDTGQVMYEKNADERIFPGYLTKIMTALVVLDSVEDIDAETTALKIYVQDMVYGSSSLAGIYNGDELSIHDLLYAMMLQSANEAALMLADYVGDGSLGHFADLMNEKARELGCTNTNFTDAAGFPDEETYTTARDFEKILAAAMEYPEFAEIMSSNGQEIRVINKDRTIRLNNYTNAMIRSTSDYYYGPAVMSMASNLESGGRSLASEASSGGYSYRLVLLGAPMQDPAGSEDMLNYSESIRLYRWAFEDCTVRTVVEKGELLAEIPVRYSMQSDHVKLETGERYMALMENSIDLSSILYKSELPEYAVAPIEKGAQIGTLHLMLADEEIGSVPLLAAESVKASRLLTALGWFGNILHTFWAKFVLLLLVFTAVGYGTLAAVLNKKRRKKSGAPRYRGRSGGTGRYL